MIKRYMLILALLIFALPVRGQSEDEPVAPLAIYVVHSEEQDDTEYFSSDEFRARGYIGLTPDLAANQFAAVLPGVSYERIVNPISGAAKEVPRYGVRINFIEEDKERFASLTKRHQGSHFLFQMRGTPVYTPTIRLPITHGWIEIAVESSREAESLAEELRPFVRESDGGDEGS